MPKIGDNNSFDLIPDGRSKARQQELGRRPVLPNELLVQIAKNLRPWEPKDYTALETLSKGSKFTLGVVNQAFKDLVEPTRPDVMGLAEWREHFLECPAKVRDCLKRTPGVRPLPNIRKPIDEDVIAYRYNLQYFYDFADEGDVYMMEVWLECAKQHAKNKNMPMPETDATEKRGYGKGAWQELTKARQAAHTNSHCEAKIYLQTAKGYIAKAGYDMPQMRATEVECYTIFVADYLADARRNALAGAAENTEEYLELARREARDGGVQIPEAEVMEIQELLRINSAPRFVRPKNFSSGSVAYRKTSQRRANEAFAYRH